MDYRTRGAIEIMLEGWVEKEELETINKVLNNLIGKTKPEIANIISYIFGSLNTSYMSLPSEHSSKEKKEFYNWFKNDAMRKIEENLLSYGIGEESKK